MGMKDMKRSNWPRVLRKDYVAQDFENNGIRGQMSLTILRELTAPLTVEYPFGKVLIADRDYHWLQIALEGHYFWITAMYNREGTLVDLYFDITAGNCFDNPENPCFRDMYLDIVISGGHLMILDEEELDEALESGNITREEYDQTQKICRELYAYLCHNYEKIMKWCEEAHRELQSLLK